MILEPITREIAEKLRNWRNQDMSGLRTPFMLTEENQQQWYDRVTARHTNSRFYAMYYREPPLLAVGGFDPIQWENSIAEISLVVSPGERGQGLGKQCVNTLLYEAFMSLNLQTIYGEVYTCNDAGHAFWSGFDLSFKTNLPNRKYWNGKYWPGMYFSWDRDHWRVNTCD